MLQKVIKTLLMTTILSMASQALAHHGGATSLNKYLVTIKNLTHNQVMSAPILSLRNSFFMEHNPKFVDLFRLNYKSSMALKKLAEEGDTSGFPATRFRVIGDSPILPGEAVSYIVSRPNTLSGGGFSMVSMLANTNDAFVGIDTLVIDTPNNFMKLGDTQIFYAKVYDAGTEYNSELCDHIPGPACGSTNSQPSQKAEGKVTLHPGLTLTGDLTNEHTFSSQAGAQIILKRIH